MCFRLALGTGCALLCVSAAVWSYRRWKTRTIQLKMRGVIIQADGTIVEYIAM